jgi:DNA-binding response OmpR family regulator
MIMETKKRILVVDDEADLRQMVTYLLEAKGYEVKMAEDGMDALEKVHQFKPDLIILDVNMPRMGGIEFYSRICTPEGKPLYPVLVLTARANIKELFHDLNIDGFMVKPFDINQLVYEAETIIRKKNQVPTKEGRSGTPKVCVIEHDQKLFDQIISLFVNAEYTVIPAKNGAAAVEKMVKDVPDVALVSLGLADIPGDILILRLNQMAKTMNVKFILYTHRDSEHDREVMNRIREKTGIMTFVEYKDLSELLDAVNQLYK